MNLFKAKHARRRGIPLQLLALVLFFVGAKGAWAAGGSCSGNGGQTIILTLPITVSVPRDAPVGSVLTDWVLSPATTNYWTCSTSADNALVFIDTGSQFTTDSGVKPTGGAYGNPYVYKTNIPGIGVAIAGNGFVAVAGWGGWGRSGGVNRPTYWGIGPANYSNYAVGGQVAVALVKTAPQVTAGGTVTGGQVAKIYPATGYGNTYTGKANFYVTTDVQIVPLACATPDVTVDLGKHSSGEMTAIGSTTTAANFNISVNNCPGGLSAFGPAIQYRVDATTTVVNSAQSVVALDSGSSAKGAGVQLLDGNGAVFPLATYKTFTGYDKANGGSYTIPFKARYYRTGSVTPGTANTSMTFTMLYQ